MKQAGPPGPAAAFRFCEQSEQNEESQPETCLKLAFRKAAAAYSPNWWVSTIGVSVLNFSVRDGKRWVHTAITTAVYF